MTKTLKLAVESGLMTQQEAEAHDHYAHEMAMRVISGELSPEEGFRRVWDYAVIAFEARGKS